MKYTIAIVLALSVLVGCATFDKLVAGPDAPLVNSGIEYLTVKAVKTSHSPAGAAKDARAVLDQIDALAVPGGLAVSLDTVDVQVRKIIASKATSAEDAILFDAIRQAAYQDLASRIPSAGATLSASDIAAIRSITSDIRNGLTLAGY